MTLAKAILIFTLLSALTYAYFFRQSIGMIDTIRQQTQERRIQIHDLLKKGDRR